MIIRLILLGVCLVCAAGLVVSGVDLYAARQVADRGDVISQPQGWVAFEATITRIVANGLTVDGSFHRGEDGSEVTVERVPNSPSSVTTIRHISNYLQGRYYHSSKAGAWTSGPLHTGPAGPRPLGQFFTKASGLRKYRRKLGLLAGQDGSLAAADGLDAWISTTDQGSVHLLVPSLNFYPVVSSMLDGERRVLSAIRVGPQPDSLFEPPPGEHVEFVTDPFPIRRR